jgi:hypothetical protein
MFNLPSSTTKTINCIAYLATHQYNKNLQHKQTKIQSFLGGVVGTNNGPQTNKHK